ncbi:hypothetical protein AVEN_221227-1 [Araneus ventricosus]|uniref:Uncharacterized protein n=1 Tax=Araneus ventricosus TaxID=182803 RepID=A0A4Y2F6V2_ARAVE|nr:hypothetical protein AVEN_221227-1 [Araneus ventricosus]
MDSADTIDKSVVVSYSIPDTPIDIFAQFSAFERNLASLMVSSIASTEIYVTGPGLDSLMRLGVANIWERNTASSANCRIIEESDISQWRIHGRLGLGRAVVIRNFVAS